MKTRLFAILVLGVALMNGRSFAVDIVAHRGASYDAPENTLAAFRLAWEQKADAIEGDFYYSGDRQIVCMHDASTERTAGVKGKIAEMTFGQIRKLDAGSWKDARFKGEQVPTLKEFLAVVPKGKRALIEIKIGPQIVGDVQKEIEASGLERKQLTIISFNDQVIAESKKAMPDVKAYWLYAFKKKDGQWSMSQDEAISKLRQIGADGFDVGFTKDSLEIVNAELARKLREAKLELHVWTVDDPALARRAIELGALSITTNRPGWLRQELDK